VFEEVLSGGGGTGIAMGRDGRCAKADDVKTSTRLPMRRTLVSFMAVMKN
jgi:hypothetical protein